MMAFYVLYILNDKYLCFDFPSNGDVLLERERFPPTVNLLEKSWGPCLVRPFLAG